jgi:Amidohydrolase family
LALDNKLENKVGNNARSDNWIRSDGGSFSLSVTLELGWQNRVGSIEPNKFADLIAITGDPLQDISELERVRFVMKGGRIVKDTLTKR